MKTFRRLLGFLRPYRRGVWGSMLLACAAMGGTTLIPYLIGEAIDRIGKGDSATLELLAGVILVTAVLRLALTVARRLIAGQVSLGVEFDLRERLVAHCISPRATDARAARASSLAKRPSPASCASRVSRCCSSMERQVCSFTKGGAHQEPPRTPSQRSLNSTTSRRS